MENLKRQRKKFTRQVYSQAKVYDEKSTLVNQVDVFVWETSSTDLATCLGRRSSDSQLGTGQEKVKNIPLREHEA